MESSELTYFLPSSWIKILHTAPLLGGKSVIIDLNQKFIEYIESDGIFLEENCRTNFNEFSDSESSVPESDFEQNHMVPSHIFTEIHEKIVEKIAFLGGCVVPKFNWTVPNDSIWISANTLKCTSTSEVYQLLKASDRIQSDIALFSCNNIATPQLFLRPFCDLVIENEFRCFVICKQLIAVSQRNLEVFSEYISSKSSTILNLVSNFFFSFISEFPVHNYSFDVYIDENFLKVYLVDINPLTESSLTCLFEFPELLKFSTRKSDITEFRYVRDNNSTRIGLCKKNFLPVDLLNINSDVNNIDFNNLHY